MGSILKNGKYLPITPYKGSWAWEQEQGRKSVKRYRVWLVNIGFYAQDDYEHLNQAIAAAQAKGFETRIDLYDYETKTAKPIRSYSPITGWSYYQ